MNKVLCLVAVCFAVVLAKSAANPPNPTWPNAFAATVFVESPRGNNFFRWFYDDVLDKGRFDSMQVWQGEQWFSQRIYDHVTEYEYQIYFQRDLESCFYRPINGTVPRPNFASFQYFGQATIGWNTVYHWFYTDKTRNATFQYWDNSVTREPVRLDITNNNDNMAETWHFWEFDEAQAEDTSLFSIPQQIISTCNRV